MIKLKTATELDIPKIQNLAEEIWWSIYPSILSSLQIRYMLDTLYSKETLQAAMSLGEQNFILLFEDGIERGFASYGEQKENKTICKLHKLYVLPAKHKKGFGRLLIEDIKVRLLHRDIHVMSLNVNRNNPAKVFYEKLGFSVVYEEDIAIGPFWMNDYVMVLEF